MDQFKHIILYNYYYYYFVFLEVNWLLNSHIAIVFKLFPLDKNSGTINIPIHLLNKIIIGVQFTSNKTIWAHFMYDPVARKKNLFLMIVVKWPPRYTTMRIPFIKLVHPYKLIKLNFTGNIVWAKLIINIRRAT